jgi:regulatory protein
MTKNQGRWQKSKRSSPPEKSDSKREALERAMQFIAMRDHSEQELKRKLNRKFTPEAVQNAIENMKEQNWITDPETLAQRVTDTLHRKKKGHLYIKNYLRKIGLKETARNSEIEIQKAQKILEKKFPKVEDGHKYDRLSKSRDESRKRTQKMIRFLSSRGFDSEIVRKVVYDWTRS